MAHIHAVITASPLYRPITIREDDELALFDGDGFAASLRARALFVEQEFATGVIASVLIQDAGSLQREGDLTI